VYRWYCFDTHFDGNLFAGCKVNRCSNLASKLPVRRWRSRRFRRVSSMIGNKPPDLPPFFSLGWSRDCRSEAKPSPSCRRGQSQRTLKHQSHRLRHVAEALALFSEMTDAGPRQMVDERRHVLGCEHVHDLDARFDALLGIGVEAHLHARFLHQDDMVHEVADDEERLAARVNHEAGMADRVPRGMHCLDAGKDFLTILVEHNTVLVRDEVLARGERRAFGWRAEPLV